MSARNSGKERRQTPRSVLSPSFSSFALAFSDPRRARRMSQRGCRSRSASYEASAQKAYLCSERLMKAIRDVSVVLKSERIGLMSVL
jgi:hypothetical protein